MRGLVHHRKANILAVDDKRANLIALEAVLGSTHNLVLAESGAEALALLERRRDIDLILLDVQMPGLDGYETAAQVRALPHAQDIPIIFITAIYSEDAHVKRGYEAGGIDYFSKPFDPDILRMKVDVYAGFRLERELLQEREVRIRESEELLRVGRNLATTLDRLKVGVLIADSAGRMCQMTDEAGRILRANESTKQDVYGQLLEWWQEAGEVMKGPQSPLQRAVTAGETVHNARLRVRCLDGSINTIVTSASPLKDAEGHVIGVVLLIQDVTDAWQIESELEDRVARLVCEGVARDEQQHVQH